MAARSTGVGRPGISMGGEQGRRAASVRRVVFAAKLRVPDVPAYVVHRLRLHRAVDVGLDAGAVLVVAPAGSGKTTLLADWAARQRSPREVAWVSLGRSERDPARFLSHVVAALESTEAGAEVLGPLPEADPAPHADKADPVADRLGQLSDALGELRHEVVLVLDDFHEVLGSRTEALARRVLRYPTGLLRPVILSREEPRLGQTRLRLRGELREIGPVDLSLTREEVGELLTRQAPEAGAVPGTDRAERLHRQTGGWVAAVRALATDTGPGGEAVDDYLAEEVLAAQTPEVRDFLLRAATADPVCGALADALTAGTGGARTLADLHRRRLFLERDDALGDDRCAWYRWHPMFLSLLRTRQRDEDPGVTSDLHRTAAWWLRRHGFPVEAAQHALAAADPGTAAAVLADSWVDLVVDGRLADVRSLLARFDDSQIAGVPELALAGAFVAALDRDLPRARTLARTAPAGTAGLPPDRQLAVEVMGAVLCLRIATLNGMAFDPTLYPAALALLDRTRSRPALTRGERRRRVLLLYHLGTFEASQWRSTEAAEHLQEAVIEGATLAMPQLLVRARAQLAQLDLWNGRLDLARAAAEDVLAAEPEDGWHGNQGLAGAHLTLGWVHLKQSDLPAALVSLAAARKVVHPADRVHTFRIGVLTTSALLRRARVAGSSGIVAAERELDELRRQLEHWRAPSWAPLTLAIVEAAVQRAAGRPDQALRHLERIAGDVSEPLQNALWRIQYAGLLLDTGRPSEARDLVAPIVAVRTGQVLAVEALVVDTVAAAALGQPDDAMAGLSEALRLSARGRVAEPFCEQAVRIRPLLVTLLELGTAHEEWATDLLHHLMTAHERDGTLPSEPGGASVAEARDAPAEPLTARELEVLRAMPGAASNEEIAGRLFISVNTLRSHLKQIHRKLGTSRRREAVTRARALGLL